MARRIRVAPVKPDAVRQAELKNFTAMRDAAWRARLLADDRPSGRYETDEFSPPKMKRKRGDR
jgi:hypothetical protein